MWALFMSKMRMSERVPMTPPAKQAKWKRGDTAIIKTGWLNNGDQFKVLGAAIFVRQWWVPVIGDDGDPSFFKASGLEKKRD